jgi:alpha-glucosidase
MMLLTLRGTPTLYYGDELGMANAPIPPDMVHDPAEKNQPGIGMGRDPERTPMLWDNSAAAGFTSGQPWLPLSPDAAEKNVAAESASPRSMLVLYRRLLELRRVHPALHAGMIDEVASDNGVLSYRRGLRTEHLQVFLNLTNDLRKVSCPDGHILATTILDGDGARVNGDLLLEANEGMLILLTGPSDL